jgi:alpha-tubulin suppressor-like RCC1 family protein
MTLRRYGTAKVSTTSKFSASANNFRAVARQKVSVNILAAGEIPPPPPVYYLWAWGKNTFGSIGDGTTIDKSSPVQIGALTTWTTVNTKMWISAAIKSDGTLWTWGRNYKGGLGLGNTTDRSSPVQVGALTTWSSVETGISHTLAIKTDGTLWSWGENDYYGQLGLGDTSSRSSPTQVGSLTNWLRVSAGSYNSAAIKTNGTLWSWGVGDFGSLGFGNSTAYSSPKQVGALTNWTSVSFGAYVMTAIKTDGTLWAWGRNAVGALGLGDTTNRSSPVQVGALTNWASVSSNQASVTALDTNGTLWAWGQNNFGQLGLSDSGNTTNRSSPTQVGSLTNWSRISQGPLNVLSIKTDGTLWAWGYNYGGKLGLGDADTIHRSSPVQVGSLTTWSRISAGQISLALG